MSTYPTLNDQPLLDPGELYPQSVEQGLPLDFWGRANSYTCPRGKEPGVAYVLMLRSVLNGLSQTAFHSLVFRSPQGNVTVSVRFVRATCMTPGPTATDTNAAYLVELADKRRWLAMTTVNKQYNVRAAAPPATSGASLYHAESLNSGSIWTWATMVSDLWGLLPSSLRGSTPSLPYTPDGTPEGFRFIGVSAWDALHQVLEKIGCTTVFNPATGSFSIIRTGATQSGLTQAIAALVAAGRRCDDDLSPLEHASAFLPATVRVFFHKLYKHYGSEPLTDRVGNWSQSPAHQEDVTTNIAGAVAGTILPIWDDLPAIVNPADVVTNSAALATRAAEVAANYVNSITKRADHNHTIFGGAVTSIPTGSEVERVIWRDYGDDSGMVTEIVNRPFVEPRQGGRSLWLPSERLNTPDLSRASFPLYPRDVHLVKVHKASGSDGDPVAPAGDGLFQGKVLRVDIDADTATNDPYLTGEDCFLLVMNNLTGSATGSPTIPKGERYLGRIVGTKLVGSTTLPVYAVHEDAAAGDSGLRMDWAQMGNGFNQTVGGGAFERVEYTGGSNSAAESVLEHDTSTHEITVNEDGVIVMHFEAHMTPASSYGTGFDDWEVVFDHTGGAPFYNRTFQLDMNDSTNRLWISMHFVKSLPNGGSVPRDLFVEIVNASSSVRNGVLISAELSILWFNKPD